MGKKKESRVKTALKRFCHHKLAVVALCVLVIEVLAVMILPPVLGLDAITCDFLNMGTKPSALHLLGTDEVGRDILARLLYGGRVSLTVGALSTLMSVCIGVPLGVIAGYYQGKVGTVIMRVVDMFQSFPSMILSLVLVTVMGASIYTVIFAIGILGWVRHCKLLYGTVTAVRSSEYVEAAVAIGTDDFTIIRKYVLPNAVSPLWVAIAFNVSSAILTESSLSFLGAGIKLPQSSWGNIIYAAQNLDVLTGKQWIWIPACVVLLLSVICINMVGEGIRDAFDPKMRR